MVVCALVEVGEEVPLGPQCSQASCPALPRPAASLLIPTPLKTLTSALQSTLLHVPGCRSVLLDKQSAQASGLWLFRVCSFMWLKPGLWCPDPENCERRLNICCQSP